MYKYILLTFYIFLLSNSSVYSADTLKTKNQIEVFNVADPNELLLKYQSALLEESKLHREYLERYNERILWLIGIIGTIGISILTFFNIKSRKDIQDLVEESLKSNVEKIIKDKVLKEFSAKASELDALIDDIKNKDKFFNTILFELSGQLRDDALGDSQKLKNKLILWVDDNPENNEYPVSILTGFGAIIKPFKTSDQGKAYLKTSQRPFDLIISNMGRGANEKAGLEFITDLRQEKIMTPIIIFTRPTSIRNFGQAAIDAGAKICVTGYGQLLSQVQRILG